MRARTVLPAVVAGAMIGLNTTGDEDLALTRGITLDIYDDMIIKTEGLQVLISPFRKHLSLRVGFGCYSDDW